LFYLILCTILTLRENPACQWTIYFIKLTNNSNTIGIQASQNTRIQINKIETNIYSPFLLSISLLVTSTIVRQDRFVNRSKVLF
jgi:hypothetical protein